MFFEGGGVLKILVRSFRLERVWFCTLVRRVRLRFFGRVVFRVFSFCLVGRWVKV